MPAAWADPERWARLQTEGACPICRQETPDDLLMELEVSWVTVGEDGPMRGHACLVFRRHAVELHHLTEAEGAAFMRDVRRLSAAIQRVTGAIKLNYEVHGNTVPHLHMHFYPRHPGDLFEDRPIDARAVAGSAYAPGEVTQLRARLREALGSSAGTGPAPGGG